MFIHLNLCIALALGLIAFIAGIENATDDRVSSLANQKNTYVHIYIHYLHQNAVIVIISYDNAVGNVSANNLTVARENLLKWDAVLYYYRLGLCGYCAKIVHEKHFHFIIMYDKLYRNVAMYVAS